MTTPYRPSLSERLGVDGPLALRAIVWSLPVAVLVSVVVLAACWEHGVFLAAVAGLLAFGGTALVGSGGVLLCAHLAGTAAGRILLPSGRTTPAVEDFSREQSLVIRGQVDEAVALLERRCRAEPGNAALHLFLADLYAGDARKPHHAARTFRHVKQLRAIPAAQDLYATQRLIDLYSGPLANPDRAAVEMQHLVARHPGLRAAAYAEGLLGTVSPGPRRS